MVVGFTTTYVISAYSHQRCEFESHSGEVYLIQYYVIKFVSDLQQVGGFLQVLRFPPPGGLWFFVLFRKYFSDSTRVRIYIYFVAQSEIFFPEFNIRLYYKMPYFLLSDDIISKIYMG
jgi:hypothetical protein